MLGRVTRQNVCEPVAPNDSAASSSSRPWSVLGAGINSRATKGKVTNMVASHARRKGEQDVDVVIHEP